MRPLRAVSSLPPKAPSLPPEQGPRKRFVITLWKSDDDGQWYADMPGEGRKPGVLVHDPDKLTALSKVAAFGISE
jgi:hypothetical protein